MKMLTKIALASVALVNASFALTLTEITGFGTGDFNQLAPFGTDVQNATSYSVTGTDFGATLVGSLSAPILLEANTQTIYLTATLTFSSNPGSGFQIGLYDEDGDGRLYNGNFSSFTTTNVQVVDLALSFAGLDNSGVGGFNGTVTTVVFATNGVGAPVNLTLDSIKQASTTAVPEPSSFAALAGFAVLGLAASRRRRA